MGFLVFPIMAIYVTLVPYQKLISSQRTFFFWQVRSGLGLAVLAAAAMADICVRPKNQRPQPPRYCRRSDSNNSIVG